MLFFLNGFQVVEINLVEVVLVKPFFKDGVEDGIQDLYRISINYSILLENEAIEENSGDMVLILVVCIDI